MKLSWVFLSILVIALAWPDSPAAQKKLDPKKVEPRVLLALPFGVTAGATTRVTVRGLSLEKVKELRFTDPAVAVKVVSAGKANVPDKNPDKVGDTQVVADVTLPKDFQGVVSFVAVTELGDTKPFTLLVDAVTPVREKEPNDGFKQAQPIQMSQTVEGAIERAKDVDVYRFEGKAGQRVALEIRAARHGSALDGHLTLFDANGQQIAANDDQPGTLDPRLDVTLPRGGAYFLVVLDAHDTGGPLHAYRLVTQALP